MSADRDRLIAFTRRYSKHAEEELGREGVHPPMFMLWHGGQPEPMLRLLDDSTPNAISRWGSEIAEAALQARSTLALVVMEAKSAQLPGSTEQAKNVLIVAAANPLGMVVIETDIADEPNGRRHATGDGRVLPAEHELSLFNAIKAVWTEMLILPGGE